MKQSTQNWIVYALILVIGLGLGFVFFKADPVPYDYSKEKQQINELNDQFYDLMDRVDLHDVEFDSINNRLNINYENIDTISTHNGARADLADFLVRSGFIVTKP